MWERDKRPSWLSSFYWHFHAFGNCPLDSDCVLMTLSQKEEPGSACMLCVVLLFSCLSACLSIDPLMCAFFFLRKHFSFLLGLLGTSSLFFLFSVLLFVLPFLVPWVKRGTGNGVRCRKRKTLKVIKDVNPDTQVKLKNKSRQWKTLNHRISC